MESRKMVLKNLFTGQQWRNRQRKQTYGHGEWGGEGEVYGKSNTGIYCMSQETQTGALYQPRGERDGREAQMGGDICILMAESC